MVDFLNTGWPGTHNMSSAVDVGKYMRLDDIRLTDISVATMEGEFLSVMNQYAICEITEDLFQNVLTGIVSGIDASNVIANFPITGQEFITLSFHTPSRDKDVELVFLIDKISKRAPLKNKQSQLYDIHFVSPALMLNLFSNVNKAYTGKRISDIVEDIHHTHILQDGNKTVSTLSDRENGGQLFSVDYTDLTTNIIIPNWNAFTAINWLSQRASASGNPKQCDYVYYQDMDGFHFRSIRKMFQKSASRTLVYGEPGAVDAVRDHPSIEINIDKSLSHIRTLVIDEVDRTKEVNRGAYSSGLLLHDIVNKNYTVVTYNYLNDFENLPSLNQNPVLARGRNIFNAKPESKTYFAPTHINLYGEPTGASLNSGNDGIEEWLLRHQAQHDQFKSSSIIVEVAGDSTYRVGDKITAIINSMQGPNQDGSVDVDNSLTGSYIISSIKHMISKTKGHSIRMKLSKESNIERTPDFTNIDAGTAIPTDGTLLA